MVAAVGADLDRYREAFSKESARRYPIVDAFETEHDYAIATDRLLDAARILACPVKVNAPCWQHGRLLYTALRSYVSAGVGPFNVLDIGTAKGFSALMMRWALDDAGVDGAVTTLDVLDPKARVRRNSVIELNGYKTLSEFLTPYDGGYRITCRQSTGIDYLLKHGDRIHFAFVDGKHTGEVVAQESRLLSKVQQAGDVIVFDDVHLADVRAAVETVSDRYALRYLEVLPHRAYGIGVRL
jgi:predicted O-methyltransferase YrrM